MYRLIPYSSTSALIVPTRRRINIALEALVFKRTFSAEGVQDQVINSQRISSHVQFLQLPCERRVDPLYHCIQFSHVDMGGGIFESPPARIFKPRDRRPQSRCPMPGNSRPPTMSPPHQRHPIDLLLDHYVSLFEPYLPALHAATRHGSPHPTCWSTNWLSVSLMPLQLGANHTLASGR